MIILGESNANYITEYETDTAIIKVRFSNSSDLTREQIFNRIAQASYNLCLHEHERKMRSSNDE